MTFEQKSAFLAAVNRAAHVSRNGGIVFAIAEFERTLRAAGLEVVAISASRSENDASPNKQETES